MKRFSFFLLLAIPLIILSVNRGSGVAYAQEDENIDDIVDVESEDNTVIADDELEEETVNASTDADTTILFTKPIHNALSTLELPAGNLVEFLVGFTNKGENDFVLESLDASFRYAMDFNFYIQNFSTYTFNRVVKPKHEATLAYSFVPSETFAGRPFGLNVNLNYRDANGVGYNEAVYNETVQVIELDDGLDGETVFLYVFLAACVILTLVGGQQLLSSFGRKSRSSTTRKAPIEMGTSNPNNVDYDWLPKETLNTLSKYRSTGSRNKSSETLNPPRPFNDVKERNVMYKKNKHRH
ncbi:translocon-associated protein subunit alpha isoform X1 [Vespula pensylvanica]|uniref:translocon-associated protein subunit alpha isoform X1 n=1 Tax=Vespula pensylvanica TaxID=30213 RepID=UPI001CBA394E|nr:translocon-associated protein subunit alpha isoform X1 [Vespula pensylvanica]